MFKKLEFSKLLALGISLLYVFTVFFVGIIWGLTGKTPEQLKVGIDIINAVSTPFSIVLTGYFAKSGVENYNKYKKN